MQQRCRSSLGRGWRFQRIGERRNYSGGLSYVNTLLATTHGILFTSQAVLAGTAELVEPSHANTIADFEVGNLIYSGSKLGDDADAFVSESLLLVEEVLVCSADTAVGYFDNDFGGTRVSVAGGFDNVAGLGALEYGEIDAHFELLYVLAW